MKLEWTGGIYYNISSFVHWFSCRFAFLICMEIVWHHGILPNAVRFFLVFFKRKVRNFTFSSSDLMRCDFNMVWAHFVLEVTSNDELNVVPFVKMVSCPNSEISFFFIQRQRKRQYFEAKCEANAEFKVHLNFNKNNSRLSGYISIDTSYKRKSMIVLLSWLSRKPKISRMYRKMS